MIHIHQNSIVCQPVHQSRHQNLVLSPDPAELLSYTVDGTRTHVPSRELADYIPVRLRTQHTLQ